MWKACEGCKQPCQPKDGGTTMSMLACEQVRIEAEAALDFVRQENTLLHATLHNADVRAQNLEAKLAAAEKRLQGHPCPCPEECHFECPFPDRIAALESEVEDIKGDCERVTRAYKKAVQRNGDLSAEVARLKAENGEFRYMIKNLRAAVDKPARPDAVYCAKCGSKALPSDIGPEYCPKCGEMPLMRLKPKRKRVKK